MPPAQDRTIFAWVPLLLAACVIAPASLFVHVFMIDMLKVPYPQEVGLPGTVSVFAMAVRLITLAALVRLATPAAPRLSPFLLAGLTGILMLMLNETLRLVFIDGAILESLPCSIVNVSPKAIATFFETAIVAYFSFRRFGWPTLLAVSIAVAAIGVLIAAPWLTDHIDQWRDVRFASVTRHYDDPYPTRINVIIYVGFIEPTVAAFVLVALCWRRLGPGLLRRTTLFVLLLLLVRGRIVSLLLYSFWISRPLPIAMLAEGQFFLETLTLGFLVAIAWAWLAPAVRGTPQTAQVQIG